LKFLRIALVPASSGGEPGMCVWAWDWTVLGMRLGLISEGKELDDRGRKKGFKTRKIDSSGSSLIEIVNFLFDLRDKSYSHSYGRGKNSVTMKLSNH
jgi:hypothetical protein